MEVEADARAVCRRRRSAGLSGWRVEASSVRGCWLVVTKY